MSLITWACLRCVQELATILGAQNRAQGRCVLCYVMLTSNYHCKCCTVAAHLTSMRGSLALPDGLWPRSLETLSDIEMRIYDWDEDYFRPRINFI